MVWCYRQDGEGGVVEVLTGYARFYSYKYVIASWLALAGISVGYGNLVIWAIVGRQANSATVKHVNTRTGVGLNSSMGVNQKLRSLAHYHKLTEEIIRIYRV